MQDKFKNNKNIIINKLALSNEIGTRNIYYNQQIKQLASLYQRNLKKKQFNQSQLIQLERLDNYIKRSNINKIDFVKLDVEGHEYQVLEGMGNYLNPNFTKAIQFEYGGCNLDSGVKLADLYQILQSRGYIIAKIKPKKLENRQYNTSMENFSYCNYVALSKKIILNYA